MRVGVALMYYATTSALVHLDQIVQAILLVQFDSCAILVIYVGFCSSMF